MQSSFFCCSNEHGNRRRQGRRMGVLLLFLFYVVDALAMKMTPTTKRHTSLLHVRTQTAALATPSVIVDENMSRRDLFSSSSSAVAAAMMQAASTASLFLLPLESSALAAAPDTTMTTTTTKAKASAPSAASSNPAMITINQLLQRLHGIPTFCIVSPDGASYMLYKNDQAMAIGYAFTTFTGALTVLGDAQRNAKEKGYADVWKDATITTIPLDIAVRLALKKKQRTSPKEQTLDTLVQIIPGADEKQDGMAIDSRFRDQSKVPLFYVKELQQQDEDNGAALPLFLSRKDLFDAWSQQHPGVPLPKVQAVDLVGIFENTLRDRTEYLPSTNLVFVPNNEAVQVAKEMKARGQLPPYNPNRMII